VLKGVRLFATQTKIGVRGTPPVAAPATATAK
jgi:hypothetical protein